jgi:hypothetical protein
MYPARLVGEKKKAYFADANVIQAITVEMPAGRRVR